MYVCLCNAFTDRHVREAASSGDGSARSIYRALGCAPKCGRCKPTVEEILRDLTCETDSVTV
jgi:bacterioferritin-associated ferredoxin